MINIQIGKEADTLARWQINLAVLWTGQFLVLAGMSMILPFMPYYLQELGLYEPHEIAVWAGVIFAVNYITSFIAQPIWGGLADRYGRKVMLLRSGFGMGIVIILMGFATNPWQLLLLRMLNGTIAGFTPAAVALISTNTPKEKIGFAMGTLQSGGVAGTFLGPLIGGLLAEWVGFRTIFYITGLLLFTASLLAMIFVKEKFNANEAARDPKPFKEAFNEIRRVPQMPSLYAVTFLIQFAMLSTLPFIPLLVQELHGKGELLAFYSGLVSSIIGFSNMLSSPLLGRLSDKVGAEKILGICMIGAALASIPQVFVHNIWQLLAAQFLLGVFIGGLAPSVNALIRKYSPRGMESRSYSFNSSSLSLGNMLGPIVGGVLSGFIPFRQLFLLTALLLFINSIWVYKALIVKKKLSVEPFR